jgi:hypothetical protein
VSPTLLYTIYACKNGEIGQKCKKIKKFKKIKKIFKKGGQNALQL